MAGCGYLTKGSSKDCYNPPVAGLKDEAILLNREDVLTWVADPVNPLKISALVLKTGSKGVKIEGINNTLKARSSSAPSTIGVTFTQEFDFVVLEPGPDAALLAQEVNYGRYVAVFQDNNGHYRILGLGGGLRSTANAADSENTDMGGAYAITLSSDKEKAHGAYLQIEDVTDPANPVYDVVETKAAYDALLVAAA